MDNELLTLDDVRWELKVKANSIMENIENEYELIDSGLESLLNIRKILVGNDYLEKIEWDSVYFFEYSFLCQKHIAGYLGVEGVLKKIMTKQEVQLFNEYALERPSVEATICQLEYIRSGCSGCKYHYRHESTEDFKMKRQQLSLPNYIELTEYNFLLGHMESELSKKILEKIYSDKSLYRKFRNLNLISIHEFIYLWVRQFLVEIVRRSMENKKMLSKIMNKQPVQLSWKDIWGKRYKKLAKQKKT